MERNGGSWGRLTAAQRRIMEKVIIAWKGAANQGNVNKHFNPGTMYDEGNGVPQSIGVALVWYRKAAEQGHAEAQCSLGIMFSEC